MPGKSTLKHKTCRALGVNLIGSPSAALTLSRRPNRPGQHGANMRRKVKPFGLQLQETQKLKYFYGVSSKQLRRYYKKAVRSKLPTNVALVQSLEMRLDNVVYRLGWAESRKEARQVVTHGHIAVNGRRARTPSSQIRVGDAIGWMERSKKSTLYEIVQHQARRRTPPTWLEMNSDALEGKVAREPERADMDIRIDDRLIVEFYSR